MGASHAQKVRLGSYLTVMLAAKISDRHPDLVLFQNPDDLIFRKTATLHGLVLVWARTNFKLD